jgi:transcriptional regulator NrdR family protein
MYNYWYLSKGGLITLVDKINVKKRDNRIVKFNSKKINEAVRKALSEVQPEISDNYLNNISSQVEQDVVD